MPDDDDDYIFTATSGNQARMAFIREVGSRVHVMVNWENPTSRNDMEEFAEFYKQLHPKDDVVRNEPVNSTREGLMAGDNFLSRYCGNQMCCWGPAGKKAVGDKNVAEMQAVDEKYAKRNKRKAKARYADRRALR